MRFYLPEDVQHTYEDPTGFAEQLVYKLAPQLCEFSINDGSENDTEFGDFVENLLLLPSRWGIHEQGETETEG